MAQQKKLTPPKKYAAKIEDLEQRFEETRTIARIKDDTQRDNYKRITEPLKPQEIFASEPPEVVLYFMLKYDLRSYSDIASLCGVSRAHIQNIMGNHRNDIDFDAFKTKVLNHYDPVQVPEDLKDLPKEKWLPLKEIDGYKVKEDENYIVSNMGRVAQVIHGKERDVEYSYRKLIMYAPDPAGRIRTSIKFAEGQDKKKSHFYVNTLVAKLFVPNPDPETLTVASQKDDDYSNNKASNLFWETKSESLARKRGQKAVKVYD